MSAAAPEPIVAKRPIHYSLLDPDAIKVVRRLVRFGHQAYLVGGCVRDLLLGCRPKDFDVATSARPPQLRKLFRNCRIIGRRFRLAHMLFREGKVIEVATFRRDPPPEEDGDLLLVHDNVFGDPHQDAVRRDFTINGLFYDVAPGTIIDYVGGLADVERHLIRTIGDPGIRLQEDPIRILRAIKFSARQDLGIHRDLYQAMVRHRGLLARSAPPRVLEEIFRLMRGGSAHRSLWLAREMGVLAEILPELDRYLDRSGGESRTTWRGLQAVDVMIRSGRLPGDAVLLATLLRGPLEERLRAHGGRDAGRATEAALLPVAERLVVPRKVRDRIRQILVAQKRLVDATKTGKSKLQNRDFYLDAVDLHEVRLRTGGTSEIDVSKWRSQIVPSTAPKYTKRRPPRRGHRQRRR